MQSPMSGWYGSTPSNYTVGLRWRKAVRFLRGLCPKVGDHNSEKWSAIFGECCKVDFVLTRRVYQYGHAAEFLIGFQGQGGAAGDPWLRHGGEAVGAVPSLSEHDRKMEAAGTGRAEDDV